MNKLLQIPYKRLCDNCVYSSIAHAIFILKEPFFAYTQSWDEYNYSFHYGSARGTISFYHNQELAVGAARDEKSSRRGLYPQLDAITFFKEASTAIQEKAKQDPLEYLYDEEEDVVKPMASVGFWLEGNTLFSSDDYDAFCINGGEFVTLLCKEPEELASYWKEQYALSSEEMSIISEIYRCWELNINPSIKKCKHIISKKMVGIDECIRSLGEIGIKLQ